VAAMLIYGFIVSVALTHNPGGFFYYGAKCCLKNSGAAPHSPSRARTLPGFITPLGSKTALTARMIRMP